MCVFNNYIFIVYLKYKSILISDVESLFFIIIKDIIRYLCNGNFCTSNYIF